MRGRRAALYALAVPVGLLSACSGRERTEPTSDTAVPDAMLDAGWAALMRWDALPVLDDGRASQSSSRDRREDDHPPGIDPGNKDFNNFLSICGDRPPLYLSDSDGLPCDPDVDGYVIASDDHGPGFVSRIFLGVGAYEGGVDASHLVTAFVDETLRVYVDDLSTPAYETRLVELESGGTPPFASPLVSHKSEALVSYVPISYGSKLRVVLDNLRTDATGYYYQIDRRSARETARFDAPALATSMSDGVRRLQAAAAGVDGTSSWTDTDVTIAGGETTVVLDRRGPATVRRLELTLDVAALGDIHLQTTWDDQAEPAIVVPLSALFASDPPPTGFQTLPMSVHLDGTQAVLTLTLPMPFASHALLGLENTGASSRIVHARVDGAQGVPAADWGYLRAASNEQAAPDSGARYTAVHLSGRGKYVGTIMRLMGREALSTLMPDPFNFLEGDELSLADGEASTRGTGTEEYFDGGWYFRTGPFDSLFSSAVSVGPGSVEGSGLVTAVRWQLLSDAIDFRSSFDLSFEYGPSDPSTALDYSSVALYYAE